jgi:PAS domain S-box-containing protein
MSPLSAGEKSVEQVERSLRESEGRYQALVETLPIAVIVHRDGRFVFANAAALALYAAPSFEALASHAVLDLVAEDSVATVQSRILRGMLGNPVEKRDISILRFDGQVVTIESQAAPVAFDGRPAVQVVLRDVTTEKQVEDATRAANEELESKVQMRTAQIERTNAVLRMISQCNEAIVRGHDDAALIEEICHIIRKVGGYKMAWVGYADEGEGKLVRPAGYSGFEAGYLERAQITWADEVRGRGPTGTCIRTGQICTCPNFLTDPSTVPWRADALARGYLSSIALPLKWGHQVLGALTIYAGEADSFGEVQQRLLGGLADDLAFGVMALRSRVERDTALRTAEERASQLRDLAIELCRAEHRERQRIARLLHDHLQQLLVAARFSLAASRRSTTASSRDAAAEQVKVALDEAIESSRSLTADLAPPSLHEEGLFTGLGWLARSMQQKHGLHVDVRKIAEVEPLAEEARIFLYEAVRELLFNVVKHAGVSEASVRLDRLAEGQVRIDVIDQGAGFDMSRAGAGRIGGFGLFQVRERLKCLGGKLEIEAQPGLGSCFTLILPVACPH